MHGCFHFALLLGSQFKLLFETLVNLRFELRQRGQFEFPENACGEASETADGDTDYENGGQVEKRFTGRLNFHGTKTSGNVNCTVFSMILMSLCCPRISRTVITAVMTNSAQAATNPRRRMRKATGAIGSLTRFRDISAAALGASLNSGAALRLAAAAPRNRRSNGVLESFIRTLLSATYQKHVSSFSACEMPRAAR